MGTDPAAFFPAGLCRVPPPDTRRSSSLGILRSVKPAVRAAGSFAFPVSLLAAASWEQLGSRQEKDKIRRGEKSLRGAVYYLTLSFSYTKWDSLARRFNLV